MLVPWNTLNGSHLATAQCAKGAERKRIRLAEEELRDILERSFQAYREPLEKVTQFKYLGRIIMVGDNGWKAVAGNLIKARKSWMQMTKILGREGS